MIHTDKASCTILDSLAVDPEIWQQAKSNSTKRQHLLVVQFVQLMSGASKWPGKQDRRAELQGKRSEDVKVRLSPVHVDSCCLNSAGRRQERYVGPNELPDLALERFSNSPPRPATYTLRLHGLTASWPSAFFNKLTASVTLSPPL